LCDNACRRAAIGLDFLLTPRNKPSAAGHSLVRSVSTATTASFQLVSANLIWSVQVSAIVIG
jgi:hypothetical protein